MSQLLVASVGLVELEIIERSLVGKIEQDLVMFGDMRDKEGSIIEGSFSGVPWVDRWMDGVSNNQDGKPWLK